jgi:hypothetical protein
MVSRSIVPRSVETAPGGLARRVQCEVLRTDESAFAKNGRALERVAELADVARPVVPEQRLPGVPREARRRTRERLPDRLQLKEGGLLTGHSRTIHQTGGHDDDR